MTRAEIRRYEYCQLQAGLLTKAFPAVKDCSVIRRNIETVAASFLCTCLFFSAASASEKNCTGQSDVPMVKLLMAPPCATCDETKAEMNELLDLQHSRTPAESGHAEDDAKRSVARFLEGAGIPFDAAELEKCDSFFSKRRKEERDVVEAAKNTFCRSRPFNLAGNKLEPLKPAKPDDSFSYPSGHATYGATIGFLLAEMLPEKRSEIYNRINDYAHSRLVAGVHFRSDVEAGKLMGAAIGSALFASDGFKDEFAQAKTCVRKAVKF
jgi:acid phosphatase (class A)